MVSKATNNQIKYLVNQRVQIWQRYDEALKRVKELNNFSSYFKPSATPRELQAQSQTKTPPDEIAVVVEKIKKQKEIIETAKTDIKRWQNEILETNKQFFKFAGIASGIGLMLILILMIIT